MSRLRLITFDVKDTILKVRVSPGRAYAEVARAHGINISDKDVIEVYRSVWDEKQKEFPVYGIHKGMTTREWWREFVTGVFMRAGFKGKPSELSPVFDALYTGYSISKSWEPMPNAKETLKFLRSNGLKTAIVSNFDERLEGVLRATGLRDYFDILVSSWTAKAAKPDPEIFRYALKEARMKPEEAGHIGDDVTCDYVAPRSVGMSAFLYDPNRELTNEKLKDVDRTHVLRDLMELKRFISAPAKS